MQGRTRMGALLARGTGRASQGLRSSRIGSALFVGPGRVSDGTERAAGARDEESMEGIEADGTGGRFRGEGKNIGKFVRFRGVVTSICVERTKMDSSCT